jgi:hypothetical protein
LGRDTRKGPPGGGIFVYLAIRGLKTEPTKPMTEEVNGKKTEKKWYLKKRMFVVYAVLVLLLIGSIGGSKGSSSTETQAAGQSAPTEPAITVTAFKMAADYKENEVAADAKYKGKTVEISGIVDTIGKDILDTPYIAFATENQYEVIDRVQCMFGKNDIDALAKVTKGQKITLRGEVSGLTGNILVNDCQIVQ